MDSARPGEIVVREYSQDLLGIRQVRIVSVHLSPTAYVSLLSKANAIFCAVVDSGFGRGDEACASQTR